MGVKIANSNNLIAPWVWKRYSKGLEVCVWQTAGSVYYRGLLPGTNRGATEDEITNLAANGATVEEMKVILSSRVHLSRHAYTCSRLQTTLTK